MEKARPYIVLTIVVGLLIGALAIVDTVVRGQAENQVADRLATSLNMTSKPDVTLHGWPFLVSALTRSVPKAEVKADSVTTTVGGKPATLTDVKIVATNIEPDGDGYLLKHIDAQGTVTYESLSSYAGSSRITGRDNGRIAITYSTEVLGQRVQAVVTGVPQLDVSKQEINLREAAVEVAGVTLTDQLAEMLINAVAKPLSVRQTHVTVQTIEVKPEGVFITATAENYTVSGV